MTSNTVILSGHLGQRYPVPWLQIRQACSHASLRVVEIPTRNIWTRDFMPIQVGDHFLKFHFRGFGGDDECFRTYPWLRVPPKTWSAPFAGRRIVRSRLALDGGNIIRNAGQSIAVLTEIVFRHNPQVPKTRLIARLEKLLQAEIILVPVEPGDDIGHTDGILKFIGPRKVLLNDYARHPAKQYQRYAARVQKALAKANIAFQLFPYAYHKCPQLTLREFRARFPQADSFNPGFGYYINFLLAGRLALVPQLGIEEDAEALAMVARCYPQHSVRPVDCSALSMEGGLVNCVTSDYAL